MPNSDQGMLTSASLKDKERDYSLGACVSLDFSVIQYNMTHIFLDYHMEAEENVS